MSNDKPWSNDLLQGIMGPMPNPSHGDASFLGIQFGPDALLPTLNPWLVGVGPHVHVLESRVSMLNDQDAWTPLQVTGVPVHNPGLGRYQGQIDGCSTGQDPSENGNGLPSGDSGYGGRSCATRSVVSFAVDSACSPHLTCERERDDRSMFEVGFSGYDDAEKTESSCLGDMKCHYPNCTWEGKCPSDKRKHEARHRKLFKCDEPNCTRKEGFGTINDLARHRKCVHKQEPERGPKILYMCFGRNCPRRNKKWPRLDNFRQHLSRMHGDEDGEELLRRSLEWYESTKTHELASVDDRISEEFPVPTPQTLLLSESDCVMVEREQNPCSSTVCETDFRSQDGGLVSDPVRSGEQPGQAAEPALVASQQVELPAFNTLNLTPTLDQRPPIPQDSSKNDHIEDFIAEAATNMLNALTRMMNTNQRRHTQPTYENDQADPSGELCGPKKEILQRILTAALDRLSGNTGPSRDNVPKVSDPESNKKDWIKCEFCSKRTRLRCEMKKHQKRHERPYGCTFKRCNKTFGSKADWKRHENSQHYHLQSWRCTLHSTQVNLPCARLFYRPEIYMQHLKKHHHVDDEGVQTAICKNRIDLNGQSQFWCGFCREIIPLRDQGLAAWNERFDHIDVEHFRRGERIGDWLLPSGHLTKEREWEEAKRRSMACSGDESQPFADGNAENDHDCSDCSDIAFDESIVLEQEVTRQNFDQLQDESSAFPQSSERDSRKRKIDTLGSMVAHCQPHADDGPIAKRRFSADVPLHAESPHEALVSYSRIDSQSSGLLLVSRQPYHDSVYQGRSMH